MFGKSLIAKIVKSENIMEHNLKLTKDIKKKVIEVLKKHGTKKISIFGSFVRGKATDKSDLDVIVEFNEVKGLIAFVEIQNELSDALNMRIGLLTESSISPYLIDKIKKEAVVIYG